MEDALIRLEKWALSHTDRWVDITKLKGAFREHVKAPKNSSCSPRNVFLSCVWFSEQTSIISVYSSMNCCKIAPVQCSLDIRRKIPFFFKSSQVSRTCPADKIVVKIKMSMER